MPLRCPSWRHSSKSASVRLGQIFSPCRFERRARGFKGCRGAVAIVAGITARVESAHPLPLIGRWRRARSLDDHADAYAGVVDMPGHGPVIDALAGELRHARLKRQTGSTWKPLRVVAVGPGPTIQEAPELVFRPRGPAQLNDDLGRLQWQFGPAGSPPVVTGMDVAVFEQGEFAPCTPFSISPLAIEEDSGSGRRVRKLKCMVICCSDESAIGT